MQAFPALPRPLGWYLGKRSEHLNRLSSDWAQHNRRCEVVDPGFLLEPGFIAADGFHPGPEAYSWWATHLAGRIVDRWRQRNRAMPTDHPATPAGHAK
jgi:lysophospholipase L1-like esterase